MWWRRWWGQLESHKRLRGTVLSFTAAASESSEKAAAAAVDQATVCRLVCAAGASHTASEALFTERQLN